MGLCIALEPTKDPVNGTMYSHFILFCSPLTAWRKGHPCHRVLGKDLLLGITVAERADLYAGNHVYVGGRGEQGRGGWVCVGGGGLITLMGTILLQLRLGSAISLYIYVSVHYFLSFNKKKYFINVLLVYYLPKLKCFTVIKTNSDQLWLHHKGWP